MTLGNWIALKNFNLELPLIPKETTDGLKYYL